MSVTIGNPNAEGGLETHLTVDSVLARVLQAHLGQRMRHPKTGTPASQAKVARLLMEDKGAWGLYIRGDTQPGEAKIRGWADLAAVAIRFDGVWTVEDRI